MLVAIAALCAVLVPAPTAAGWVSLFDGKTLSGWETAAGKPADTGWEVRDGCIVRVGRGGDIFTAGRYRDFELELEWKMDARSNGGVKYRLHRLPDGSYIGPEYQVYDENPPKSPAGKGSCAALYSIKAPEGAAPRPIGQWNKTRIVASGNHIEHWLNGRKVVEIDQGPAEWSAALAQSKFAVHDGYAEWFGRDSSAIMLQDHGGRVWYRRIRLKEIDSK